MGCDQPHRQESQITNRSPRWRNRNPDFSDRKRNIRLSTWLAVDVPVPAAERIPDLEQAIKTFARDWIAMDKTGYSGAGYAIGTGVAETNKLRVFTQEM